MRSLILFVLFSAALPGLNGARGGLRKAKAKEVKIFLSPFFFSVFLVQLDYKKVNLNQFPFCPTYLYFLLTSQELHDAETGDNLECQNVSFSF